MVKVSIINYLNKYQREMMFKCMALCTYLNFLILKLYSQNVTEMFDTFRRILHKKCTITNNGSSIIKCIHNSQL